MQKQISLAEWFSEANKTDNGLEEENQEYKDFVEKFKPKKTTDDCYTPEPVYDVIAGWVSEEYGVDRGQMLRPFYPGGDYENDDYPDGCVVVDNPPFSIISRIVAFYIAHNIQFFLFAPALTLFSSNIAKATALCAYCDITYTNGATVKTSFVTNLEDPGLRARTVPELYRRVKAANEAVQKRGKRELPKYSYPDNVVTAAMMGRWCQYGVDYRLYARDCVHIRELDAQKAAGKAIFGAGFLLSEKAAAEKAAAEKAAAEKAAAEKAAATRWKLSEREVKMVKSLVTT